MASGTKAVLLVALVCNVAIAAAKLVAVAVTGSSVMLAEAIHSLTNVSHQALLYRGRRRGDRSDAEGRKIIGQNELYFWNFVVAILLFGLSAGIAIYDGTVKLLNPHPLLNPSLNYLVLTFSGVLLALSAVSILTEINVLRGEKPIFAEVRGRDDPSLYTILVENLAGFAGLTVAFGGIVAAGHAGYEWVDGAASIAVGLIMALVAAQFSVKLRGLLRTVGISRAGTRE